MKNLIMMLLLCAVVGCGTEGEPAMSTDEAALCTVEVCTTEYGCRSFLVDCGPTGPGDGPGLPGDGYDADPQIGEVCNVVGYMNCEAEDGLGTIRHEFCCSGYFSCRHKYGECVFDPHLNPPPSPPPSGGGGGGGSDPPCHGSRCQVEQGVPAQSQ